MNKRPTRGDKKEVREEMHLTRPPRLEGKVKNAGVNPKRKPKGFRAKHPRKKK